MERRWLHEPAVWAENDGVVTVTTDPGSDFWRVTHYGFIRDNGHFYYWPQTGDFVAEVTVTGAYRDLYDQAGLMLRVDDRTWLKCGIEFVGGVQQVSAVVTRDYSDWSVTPLPMNPAAIRLRVTRQGPAIEIHYAVTNDDWQLLRLAYLTDAPTLSLGLMCASPEGQGFTVRFENLDVADGTTRDKHE